MNTAELAALFVRLLVATAFFSSVACILGAHLIWNWTPSLPRGLYWLSRGARPVVGHLVAFPVPAPVEWLVHERRYLPPGAMLVKPVVAMAGDRVCTENGVLSVERTTVGRVLTEDSAGRPLPHYDGCGSLEDGQLFVASHYAKSFDSRTFGPIAARDVQGTVTPLWTY
jgi:conjugative transfer signal peptidase TraF